MQSRPRTKFVLQLKDRRCPKCGAEPTTRRSAASGATRHRRSRRSRQSRVPNTSTIANIPRDFSVGWDQLVCQRRRRRARTNWWASARKPTMSTRCPGPITETTQPYSASNSSTAAPMSALATLLTTAIGPLKGVERRPRRQRRSRRPRDGREAIRPRNRTVCCRLTVKVAQVAVVDADQPGPRRQHSGEIGRFVEVPKASFPGRRLPRAASEAGDRPDIRRSGARHRPRRPGLRALGMGR